MATAYTPLVDQESWTNCRKSEISWQVEIECCFTRASGKNIQAIIAEEWKALPMELS